MTKPDLVPMLLDVSIDPCDGSVHPSLQYVLIRGFTAMGWEQPKAASEDMAMEILKMVRPSNLAAGGTVKPSKQSVVGENPISQGMLRTQEIMCAETMKAKIAILAQRFWSIHPSEIAAKNLTREQFYAREMEKLLIQPGSSEATPSTAGSVREALEDCRTHRNAWRKALEIALARALVIPPDIDDKSYWQHELRAFDRTFDALAHCAPVEGEKMTCERCQGNGEIVKDWIAYLHPTNLSEEEASVADCPDCDGEGTILSSAPVEAPVAWRWRFADKKAWNYTGREPKWKNDPDIVCEALYATAILTLLGVSAR